jgi:hypothetical protein
VRDVESTEKEKIILVEPRSELRREQKQKLLKTSIHRPSNSDKSQGRSYLGSLPCLRGQPRRILFSVGLRLRGLP